MRNLWLHTLGSNQMNTGFNFKSSGTFVRILGALAFGVASSALLTFSTTADARGERAGRDASMATGSIVGANRSNINSGNTSRHNVNTGGNRNNLTTSRNRSNVNTGNINTGNVNNIQGGDRNTSINIDKDIDVDDRYHGGHYGGYHDHVHYPVAAGAVIGAMAVTTAAVVGSYYYALPPSGCAVVIINGFSYQRCGSVYYQQTWQGDKVVYVVVKP